MAILAVVLIIILLALFALYYFDVIDLSFLGLGMEDDTNTSQTQTETKKHVVVTPTAAELSEIDVNNCIKVHFIDVGQGDAILVELGNDTIMLIDAGHTGMTSAGKSSPYGYNSVPKAISEPYFAYLDEVISANGGDIDYLIATHPDSDHINMLPKVFEKYQVNEVFINDCYNDEITDATSTVKATETAAETEPSCELHEFSTEEDTVIPIDGGNYKLTVYSAGNDGFKGARTKANSMSILCLLEFGGRKVLFTGDAEVETEKWFIEKTGNDPNFDIDVLKVPHHGSTSSCCEEFLDYVKAEYGVILYGDNSYNLPATSTMAKLNERNMTIYSTKENGNVVLYIDYEGDFCFITSKTAEATE